MRKEFSRFEPKGSSDHIDGLKHVELNEKDPLPDGYFGLAQKFTCPHCGENLNCATKQYGTPEEDIAPTDIVHDVVICVTCSTILEFDSNNSLRLISNESWDYLPEIGRA